MNVSDDLLLAQRLPTDDGWSYTLATRLGQLLRSAEQQFGTRDTSYTPLGFEFVADGPRTWYPHNCRHVVIQLGSICATDTVRACYQLAHESIHLLSPTGVPNSSNILEEGLATVFSYRYVRDTFGLDWSHSGDARYDSAAAAVEKLLAIDPASIAQLRTHQQVISLIDAPLILVQYPAIGADLANELARKFA
jgi:hypothetical protein